MNSLDTAKLGRCISWKVRSEKAAPVEKASHSSQGVHCAPGGLEVVSYRRGSFRAAAPRIQHETLQDPYRVGLLLGLLGYGKAPKTVFRLPGLIRKRPLNYGV